LFVGTTSGQLFKVTNAQSNLETTEIGSDNFPTANISCIAIGDNEDNLLVTFSNYGVSSVWLTIDGGESWVEKESDLPDMPIRWAIFHPENNGQALLATEIGIWWTNTLNESNTEWIPSIDGMANVRVDMLKLRRSDNVVLAASHGRGLFTSQYENNPYVGFNEYNVENHNFSIYHNSISNEVVISSNSEVNDFIDISIISISGNIVHKEQYKSNSDNNVHTINVNKLAKGMYVIRLSYSGISESKKLIIQ
jgi:hypothetical protein